MADKNLYIKLEVDNKSLKSDLNESEKLLKNSANDVEKEAARMALAVSKKIENMGISSQARQLQNLTARMMEAGFVGTKAFTQTATAAGKLKAQIDDAKGIVEAFRPDAPFKALSTTLTASAQAFAGVQGAMALFGAESEDLQKTLLKVQAAMAFAEGFKAIDGLQDGFKQMSLVLKSKVVPAITSAVTGLGAMKLALIGSGIGIAVVALGALVSKLSEAGDEAKRTADMLDSIRFANDEGFRKIKTQIAVVDELNKRAKKSDKELYNAKIKWIDDYIEKLQMQNIAFKDEKVNEQIATAYEERYKIAEAFQNKMEQLDRKSTSTIVPKTKTPVSKIGMANDFTGVGTGLKVVESNSMKVVKSLQAVKYSIAQTSAEAMKFAQSAEDMRRLVEGSTEGLAMSIGDSLGKAFAGENVSFGNTILLAMADFGEQLGKMMIGIGITIEAFKKSLATLNPVVAVAGGIALVAAAAAVRSKIQQGGEGFADGGLIGGNSFSGDRLLAPVNSGEVVLNTGQQNELLRMVNGGGGGGQLIAKVSGKDLMFILDRTKGGFNRG